MVAGPPIRAARGHGAMLYPTAVVRSVRCAIPNPHTVDEMPMTTVVPIIVMIARSGSSMVAVMIARRMPIIIAAIVSHAFLSAGSAVVMASRDMAAWTAVGVTTA